MPRANDHAFANEDDPLQATAHMLKRHPTIYAKAQLLGETEEETG